MTVTAGTYTVTEKTLPAGWFSTDPDMVESVMVPIGGTGTVTFNNSKYGTLTIVKNTVGGNDTFGYTITGGPASVTDKNVTTSGGPPGTGQTVVSDLKPGAYTVTEKTLPAGWFSTDPDMVEVGNVSAGGNATVTFNNTYQPPGEGCTPGFWQGGAGSQLWNTTNDPDWQAAGGDGWNPFRHSTLFNTYFGGQGFTTLSQLNGRTMLSLLMIGDSPTTEEKAARSLIAAYLNVSFGMDYEYSITQLKTMWNDAVAGGTLLNLHTLLDTANNKGCPIIMSPVTSNA